jgi:hypothetical protein
MVPLTGAAAAGSRSRSGPPCRRCSPEPHLPSSPTARTGQTGKRDDRGNDEARYEPVRRPACAARGADGIGSIQLSEPAGENPGRFLIRHGSRPCGAHSCRPVFGSLGTPFVVENIPGAGSNVATDRVAKSAADGYTLLLMGGNSSLVINPSLYETLPFDPLEDFAPISQVFIAANVLAVPPELPVKTVAELVALAKRSPASFPMAMPASARRSIWAPNCSNTWRMSILHPCPIAAPQRYCRTCSPTESAWRSPVS